MNLKMKTLVVAVAVALGTVALPAMAADPVPPDGANIVAYIVAAGVTMALIANAKLLMNLGIKAFQWIRQALH
nr:hypothetical protein [uncultured Rhodoferax sp.]